MLGVKPDNFSASACNILIKYTIKFSIIVFFWGGGGLVYEVVDLGQKLKEFFN